MENTENVDNVVWGIVGVGGTGYIVLGGYFACLDWVMKKSFMNGDATQSSSVILAFCLFGALAVIHAAHMICSEQDSSPPSK